MDKSDELLKRCFGCKDYPDDCGIYFMVALWQKECVFFRKKNMITYNEFLNDVGIISEEEFDEIIASLPTINDFDPRIFDIYLEDLQDKDGVANLLITYILDDFNFVYAEDIDFENKCFALQDVDSLEDLETIKKLFNNWTIENYDELVEELSKEEKEDRFEQLIWQIRQKASFEQLLEFLNTLKQN